MDEKDKKKYEPLSFSGEVGGREYPDLSGSTTKRTLIFYVSSLSKDHE